MRPYIKFTSRNIQKSDEFYLAFLIGEDWFAANFPKIVGFSRDFQFVRQAGKEPYIIGFVNVNDENIPVIDLKKKIGITSGTLMNTEKLIIFEIEICSTALKFAIFYDTIGDAFEISTKKILPPPNLGKHFESGNVKGVHLYDDKCIMILNFDKSFTIDDLIDIKVSCPKNLQKENA